MMFKRLLSFGFFLISCHLASQAQTLPYNTYGNPYWIGDSLTQLPSQNPLGFSYRPHSAFPPVLPIKLNVDPNDSNAYSAVQFRAASNQNQSIAVRVNRPLAHQQNLSFDLDRISNPGWMSSSHTVYTNVRGGLLLNLIRDHLMIDLGGSALIFDRNMNGGLRSDSLRLPDDGGEFGLRGVILKQPLAEFGNERGHQHEAEPSRPDALRIPCRRMCGYSSMSLSGNPPIHAHQSRLARRLSSFSL